MIEKNFECKTIILTDDFTCYVFERFIDNDVDKDRLAFHLTHYPCEDPKDTFVDEFRFFNKINELDNYFNKKISEFKAKGFK